MRTINRSALRDFRLARGWSLQDLATRTGTTKGFLSKIETGRASRPNQALVLRLAESLDVDIASITHQCDRPGCSSGDTLAEAS